jgi:hypothetical protein
MRGLLKADLFRTDPLTLIRDYQQETNHYSPTSLLRTIVAATRCKPSLNRIYQELPAGFANRVRNQSHEGVVGHVQGIVGELAAKVLLDPLCRQDDCFFVEGRPGRVPIPGTRYDVCFTSTRYGMYFRLDAIAGAEIDLMMYSSGRLYVFEIKTGKPSWPSLQREIIREFVEEHTGIKPTLVKIKLGVKERSYNRRPDYLSIGIPLRDTIDPLVRALLPRIHEPEGIKDLEDSVYE